MREKNYNSDEMYKKWTLIIIFLSKSIIIISLTFTEHPYVMSYLIFCFYIII